MCERQVTRGDINGHQANNTRFFRCRFQANLQISIFCLFFFVMVKGDTPVARVSLVFEDFLVSLCMCVRWGSRKLGGEGNKESFIIIL